MFVSIYGNIFILRTTVTKNCLNLFLMFKKKRLLLVLFVRYCNSVNLPVFFAVFFLVTFQGRKFEKMSSKITICIHFATKNVCLSWKYQHIFYPNSRKKKKTHIIVKHFFLRSECKIFKWEGFNFLTFWLYAKAIGLIVDNISQQPA